MNSGGSHPLDEQEIEQLKLQLAKAEATMLNLEWRLGEAKAAVTEETWRADRAEAALAELRPAAASEEWHREYGRVLVRAFRERDEAGRERDACRTELAEARLVVDAARQWVLAWHSLPDDPDPVVLSALFRRERDFITAVGELDPVRMVSAIGLDELGHRLGPRIAALADEHSARVAVDKRVLDAAEAWRDAWESHVTELPEDCYTPQERELFAAVLARRALTGEQTEGAARHGYTSHGWPCCENAVFLDERPRVVAKCGGPGLCKRVCGAEVAALHGEVRADV